MATRLCCAAASPHIHSHGARLGSRRSASMTVSVSCSLEHRTAGSKLSVERSGAASVHTLKRRPPLSVSVTASAEPGAQESAPTPSSTTNGSHFVQFGEARIECHTDVSPNATEGDASQWLKSRAARAAFVAVLVMCGTLLGNATASAATAAEHSIGSSSLGLKVASFLRRSGLCDEAIVVAIASLPALELRGAIPVGYWMKLAPLKTYVLAVIGNMLPVPFIALYVEKLFKYVASSSERGKQVVDKVVTSTRRKAEPIEEFRWVGLMLFVAVPFPGTGAWTGAFAASILGMAFWESVTANFVGVLLAGVLVNLVVSVGVREAIFVGIALFLLSAFMWRILRFFFGTKRPSRAS